MTSKEQASTAADASPDPSVTASSADPQRPNPAAASFARISKDIEEIKEYGSYYLAAKLDGVKRSLRNLGLYAALGVIGLIAGGAMIATAAGLVIVGLANGLSVLFGHRYWLGYLVTGVVVLGVVGVVAWIMMNKLTGAWRASTIKKYEQRKLDQQQRFGRDVASRASESHHPG